jgi:enoyl-CoA hydratase
MTEENHLLLERPGDGVALVLINRPLVLNALNMALRRDLATKFQGLSQDETVRSVVIAGNGRAFCSGADLAEYVDASTVEVVRRNMQLLWGAVADCPKPVIAAVEGYALGGGCELAMHADIIIAGESARFGQPEVRLGLMPGGGGTQRLTRAIGKFQAMKILLTGQMIGAREALQMGLVSEVVSDGQAMTRALEMAQEIAALPILAVQQIKEMVIQSMNVSLEAGLRLERKAFQILFSSADKSEGIRAFLEKRTPKFTGE